MDRQEAARVLAANHFQVEDALNLIIWLPDGPENEIRLIEVNRDTFPTSEVMPVRFGRSKDIPYSCVIVDITPEEWDEIRSGKRALPKEWKSGLENKIEFLPPKEQIKQ